MKPLVPEQSVDVAKVAIIGCGNPLRGDDALAWHAAKELRQRLSPEQAEILCAHQLTPELAETASRADTVIFLDASAQGVPGQVTCHVVREETEGYDFSHHLTPAGILAMAAQLYGASPHAFLVSLCGESFDHGEEVSTAVATGLPKMVSAVQELIRR